MTSSLTWIEIKLLVREPLTLVVGLLFPIVLMVLLLASFGGEPDADFGGIGGTDFYVPSYLGAAIAVMGLIAVPTHIAAYRETGVLRRFRASGMPMRSLVLSQVAVTAVLAVTGAAAMVGLAYGGFEMAAPGSIGGVVVGFTLGVLAFAAFGVLLGSLMPTARAAQGLGLLLFFGTFFLVGGGPPPSLLPDALNSTMAFTPLGQLVDAIRSPWTTGSWDPSALVALGAITVVAATLGARRLAAAGER